MKVLIADDDPVSRRLLEATLQKWGSEVVAARDGAEAAAFAGERPPDIVITDILMPRMNGYELCRRIKADSRLKGVPVILLTALADPTDVIEALQCGADGFITKPFDSTFLATSVENLLARREQQKEERRDGNVEMFFAGRKYVLKPDVKQITNLLLSTYDNALQKNLQLEQANQALFRAKEELREANQELIEKQRRLDKDLTAAAGIQRSLLPRDAPGTDVLETAWRFQPCELIGGDIFNMVRVDETHYAFYMLDVSGHGVPSALVTVSVSQRLHPGANTIVKRTKEQGASYEVVSPSEVLRQLDREYPIERFDKFFTIAYLLIDTRTGTLRYSNAGHPPPFLLRADGTLEMLDRGGSIVGLGSGLPFEEEEKSLGPGDRIILYTDGLLEHHNLDGEMYGEQRLKAAVRRLSDFSIESLLENLMNEVLAFGRQAPRDDISLLGITHRGN